jgi:hypothetical protein
LRDPGVASVVCIVGGRRSALRDPDVSTVIRIVGWRRSALRDPEVPTIIIITETSRLQGRRLVSNDAHNERQNKHHKNCSTDSEQAT